MCDFIHIQSCKHVNILGTKHAMKTIFADSDSPQNSGLENEIKKNLIFFSSGGGATPLKPLKWVKILLKT